MYVRRGYSFNSFEGKECVGCWANEPRSHKRSGRGDLFPAAYVARGSFAAKTYIRTRTTPPATQAIAHSFIFVCVTSYFGFVVGSSRLFCLNSNGKVLALSLPNLSPLMDVECSFLLKEYRLETRLQEWLKACERIECSLHTSDVPSYLLLVVEGVVLFRRFLKTLVFSEDAQALILCSPFEIQRLSMFVRPG